MEAHLPHTCSALSGHTLNRLHTGSDGNTGYLPGPVQGSGVNRKGFWALLEWAWDGKGHGGSSLTGAPLWGQGSELQAPGAQALTPVPHMQPSTCSRSPLICLRLCQPVSSPSQFQSRPPQASHHLTTCPDRQEGAAPYRSQAQPSGALSSACRYQRPPLPWDLDAGLALCAALGSFRGSWLS